MQVQFDDREADFIYHLALDNDITATEIIDMALLVLFTGGYSGMAGKEGLNVLERKDEGIRRR